MKDSHSPSARTRYNVLLQVSAPFVQDAIVQAVREDGGLILKDFAVKALLDALDIEHDARVAADASAGLPSSGSPGYDTSLVVVHCGCMTSRQNCLLRRS